MFIEKSACFSFIMLPAVLKALSLATLATLDVATTLSTLWASKDL